MRRSIEPAGALSPEEFFRKYDPAELRHIAAGGLLRLGGVTRIVLARKA